jgi:hypothetical protein
MTDAPRLPDPRGPLTEGLFALLRGDAGDAGEPSCEPARALGDDDLQLALYCAYELHYRSFADVRADAEWDPRVLAFRAGLERSFEAGLRGAVGRVAVEPASVGEALFALAASDEGPSLSRHLDRRGTLEQFREFAMHRSAYQLKEADPHTWAIPRLAGRAKAALVEIQADEYGSGRVERMHSALFAQSLRALGLDDSYGAYLAVLPGTTLATVNLITLFGLHRRLRGALVGHLAMFEITSPQPNRRYANALRRLGLDTRATDFYDEHVIADSVHENVAAYDMAQALAVAEPPLARDVIWGARCLLALEGAFAGALLSAFESGESSLLAAGATALRA